MGRKKTLRKRVRKFIGNQKNHRNGKKWLLRKVDNLQKIENFKAKIRNGEFNKKFRKRDIGNRENNSRNCGRYGERLGLSSFP